MNIDFTYKVNLEEVDKQIHLKYKKEFDELAEINKLPAETLESGPGYSTNYSKILALIEWHEKNDSKINAEYINENSRVIKNMLDIPVGRQVKIDNNISIIRVPGGWLYTTLDTTNLVFVSEPKK